MHSNTILQDIVVFLKQAAGTRSYVPVYIDRQGDSGVRPVFVVVVVVAVGSLVKIVSPQQFAGGHNRSQFYIVRNRLTAGCTGWRLGVERRGNEAKDCGRGRTEKRDGWDGISIRDGCSQAIKLVVYLTASIRC
jgi:hypothetical protein